MHEKYCYRFDAIGLIEAFGGAPAVARIMREMGADLRPKAIQKMRERGTIQSDAVATLLIASLKMGKPINPYEFILEREEKEKDAA